eukprot:g4420.t1
MISGIFGFLLRPKNNAKPNIVNKKDFEIHRLDELERATTLKPCTLSNKSFTDSPTELESSKKGESEQEEPSLVCYLCGQAFPRQKLTGHIEECLQNWRQREEGKAMDERVPIPDAPEELSFPLPATDDAVDQFNWSMSSCWLKSINVRCQNCSKPVKADVYYKHIKSCQSKLVQQEEASEITTVIKQTVKAEGCQNRVKDSQNKVLRRSKTSEQKRVSLGKGAVVKVKAENKNSASNPVQKITKTNKVYKETNPKSDVVAVEQKEKLNKSTKAPQLNRDPAPARASGKTRRAKPIREINRVESKKEKASDTAEQATERSVSFSHNDHKKPRQPLSEQKNQVHLTTTKSLKEKSKKPSAVAKDPIERSVSFSHTSHKNSSQSKTEQKNQVHLTESKSLKERSKKPSAVAEDVIGRSVSFSHVDRKKPPLESLPEQNTPVSVATTKSSKERSKREKPTAVVAKGPPLGKSVTFSHVEQKKPLLSLPEPNASVHVTATTSLKEKSKKPSAVVKGPIEKSVSFSHVEKKKPLQFLPEQKDEVPAIKKTSLREKSKKEKPASEAKSPIEKSASLSQAEQKKSLQFTPEQDTTVQAAKLTPLKEKSKKEKQTAAKKGNDGTNSSLSYAKVEKPLKSTPEPKAPVVGIEPKLSKEKSEKEKPAVAKSDDGTSASLLYVEQEKPPQSTPEPKAPVVGTEAKLLNEKSKKPSTAAKSPIGKVGSFSKVDSNKPIQSSPVQKDEALIDRAKTLKDKTKKNKPITVSRSSVTSTVSCPQVEQKKPLQSSSEQADKVLNSATKSLKDQDKKEQTEKEQDNKEEPTAVTITSESVPVIQVKTEEIESKIKTEEIESKIKTEEIESIDDPLPQPAANKVPELQKSVSLNEKSYRDELKTLKKSFKEFSHSKSMQTNRLPKPTRVAGKESVCTTPSSSLMLPHEQSPFVKQAAEKRRELTENKIPLSDRSVPTHRRLQKSFSTDCSRSTKRNLLDAPNSERSKPPTCKGPVAYHCYLCGRQFGSASLIIHVRQCRQLWEDREALKPKKQDRRPPPPSPKELESPLPKDAHGIACFNETMVGIWESKSLISCPYCARTFTCEAFEKHQRVCTPQTPGGPHGLSKYRQPGAEITPNSATSSERRKEGLGFDVYSGPTQFHCYLCGRQYGNQSLMIHIPRCQKLWIQREAKKPWKEDRRPLPELPTLIKDFPDVKLPTDPKEVVEFNNAMYEYWDRVSLCVCKLCGRSFKEESFEKHQKVCTSENPGRTLGVSKQYHVPLQESLSHESKKENCQERRLQPKCLVCYLCGRHCAAESLLNHISQCEKQWIEDEAQKPEHLQKPLPLVPEEIELGYLPKTLEEIAEFNQEMMAVFEEHTLVTCKTCNRKFNPEAYEMHLRRCVQDHRRNLSRSMSNFV